MNINIEVEQKQFQSRLEQIAARKARVEAELKDLREAEIKLMGILDYLHFQSQQPANAAAPVEEAEVIQ